MGSEATATVKLFAALRDAAGTGEVTVPAPAPLTQVLTGLAERLGETFAQRLPLAAVLVDGNPVGPVDEVVVEPGAEVALLPPFAGGSRARAWV